MSSSESPVDPGGLLEYSVVFTDRSLNHMSQSFQGVMRELSSTLKEVYGADAVVVIPGGGTYGMEAVARQFASGKRCLVVRNGWFSFRWTQILDAGDIASACTVMKARQVGDGPTSPFAPAPIDEVVAAIYSEKPNVVFAPHVETSSGMMLPDDYVSALGEAARAVGALFVLDCIASGAMWVDMAKNSVDVLISAPQKGWSSTPCAGLVMLSARALEVVRSTSSTSFSLDLGKWLQIMEAYEGGGHAYHATMPTDSLKMFREAMSETQADGFDVARDRQAELGRRVRALLEERGFPSVAAPGFQAPGVVVSYTDDDGIRSGKKFGQVGVQIAAGVPLRCDEPEGFRTFRIGLFGLDKLRDIDGTVARLGEALERME